MSNNVSASVAAGSIFTAIYTIFERKQKNEKNEHNPLV